MNTSKCRASLNNSFSINQNVRMSKALLQLGNFEHGSAQVKQEITRTNITA